MGSALHRFSPRGHGLGARRLSRVAVAAAAAAAVSLLAAHHSHGRTIATFPGIERDTENQSQSSQDMIHGHAFHVPICMQWRMGVGYGAANVLSTKHGVP